MPLTLKINPENVPIFQPLKTVRTLTMFATHFTA
jgi:hypothetical protein